MNFKEWFDNQLTVGHYPMYRDDDRNDYNAYDMTVNVSDEFYPDIDHRLRVEFGCVTHWFPMSEAGHDNGIGSIYGACYVLRIAEDAGMRVYLHCHAGVHRSRVVQAAYYFMRANNHYDGYELGGYSTALHYDCAHGYLPPIKEMESFLGTMSKFTGRLKNKYVGGTLDDSKIGHIHVYKLPAEKKKRRRFSQ